MTDRAKKTEKAAPRRSLANRGNAGAIVSTATQLDLIHDWIGPTAELRSDNKSNAQIISFGSCEHFDIADPRADRTFPNGISADSLSATSKPASAPKRQSRALSPDSKVEPSPSIGSLHIKSRSIACRRCMAKPATPNSKASGPINRSNLRHTERNASLQVPLFLGVEKVARRYDVAVATIWRWVADKSFPKPRKLSGRITRWAVADLDAYDRMIG